MMLLRFWRFEICFMASSSNSSRSSSRQRFRHSCTNVSLVRVGFISKICRVVMKSSWSHISHNSATTYWYFQKVLKISLWSTYFVYVRTPKTRGFPKDFQRFLILGFLVDIFRIFSMLSSSVSYWQSKKWYCSWPLQSILYQMTVTERCRDRLSVPWIRCTTRQRFTVMSYTLYININTLMQYEMSRRSTK